MYLMLCMDGLGRIVPILHRKKKISLSIQLKYHCSKKFLAFIKEEEQYLEILIELT